MRICVYLLRLKNWQVSIMPEQGAIFCIIDGMTDEAFNVQAYPNLAAMKNEGFFGYFETVPKGFPVESYPCIASLFGIREGDLPLFARGYLEALGKGIQLAEDDLVLRASWMRLAENGCILGVAEPPQAVPRFSGLSYHHLGAYRALLVVPNAKAALKSLKTYPPYAYVGKNLEEILPQGEKRLTQMVRQSLGTEKVLLPWGQSVSCPFPAFKLKAAAVGAALIFQGLAKALGLDVYTKPDFTADTDTALTAKVELALQLAQVYPLVFLHINGADEAAHRRDIWEKRFFLEQVDAKVLAPLQKSGAALLVCGDHGTSPVDGKHIGIPQPFVLYGQKRQGDLGTVQANKAVKLLLEDELWQRR